MKRSSHGFTLLEVMIAVAILSISLTSLLSSQMASMRATRYARGVSVAIFLAESKLVDIESDMRFEGWGNDDRDFDGNFSDEGWPDIRYQCLVDYIELPDYNALVQAKEAGDTEGADGGPEPFVADAEDQAMGSLGMVWPIVKAAVEQSIRKASCTVFWTDGNIEHDATISTFWTDPKQLLQLPQSGETTEDDDTREGPTDPAGGGGGGGGAGGKGGEGRPTNPGVAPTGGMKPGGR
jgi:prepilin-type N-terminal cleavage/methylation domain-containing protein